LVSTRVSAAWAPGRAPKLSVGCPQRSVCLDRGHLPRPDACVGHLCQPADVQFDPDRPRRAPAGRGLVHAAAGHERMAAEPTTPAGCLYMDGLGPGGDPGRARDCRCHGPRSELAVDRVFRPVHDLRGHQRAERAALLAGRSQDGSAKSAAVPPNRRATFFAWRLFSGGLFSLGAAVAVRWFLGNDALAFPQQFAFLFGGGFLFYSIGWVMFIGIREPAEPEVRARAGRTRGQGAGSHEGPTAARLGRGAPGPGLPAFPRHAPQPDDGGRSRALLRRSRTA